MRVEPWLDSNCRPQICHVPFSSCAHSSSLPRPSGPRIWTVRSALPSPRFVKICPWASRDTLIGSPSSCLTLAELRAVRAANATGARDWHSNLRIHAPARTSSRSPIAEATMAVRLIPYSRHEPITASAAMAAVSARRMRGPSDTACQPMASKSASSSGAHPPSGPIAISS